MTKILLKKTTNDETRRSNVLKDTVLTDLDGKRPHYLASIHLAAFHGHTELVKLFLDNDIDVNTRTDEKDTPVMWALYGYHVETGYHHVETVRLLIKHEANLKLQNDKDATPLMLAIRYGFTELVGDLLDRKRTKDGRDDGNDCKMGLEKPIVLAAALGHKEIVSKLLDCRFASNAKISHGMTALMVAAIEGNDDVVDLLVHRGRKDELEVVDKSGNTALLHASRAGNLSTMDMLVYHGASIDARNRLGETVWHHAIWRDDCDDGDDFLRAVAVLYRRAKRIDGRDMKFAKGCSPLQVYHIYYPHLLYTLCTYSQILQCTVQLMSMVGVIILKKLISLK